MIILYSLFKITKKFSPLTKDIFKQKLPYFCQNMLTKYCQFAIIDLSQVEEVDHGGRLRGHLGARFKDLAPRKPLKPKLWELILNFLATCCV